MSLAIILMESAVEAVEGRLKSPVKKQGVICRTLLKALLMECFAWLPPGSFPGSLSRLFKVHHLFVYLFILLIFSSFFSVPMCSSIRLHLIINTTKANV